MHMFLRLLLLCLGLVAITSCQPPEKGPDSSQDLISMQHLWVGTYTRKEGHVDGKGEGIYRLSVDTSRGKLQTEYVKADIHNPSFIALSPDRRFMYAVSETGPDVDDHTAYVYAFAIESDTLRLVNRQPSYSFAPCHLVVHPDGQRLLLSNYVGGMLVSYRLMEDGRLDTKADTLRLTGNGPHPRQDASHPHSVFLSPDSRFAYVCDLGTDRIMTFSYSPEKPWQPADPPFVSLTPGAGPRHLAFHPNLPVAYSINELNSTVTVFQWQEEDGALQIAQSLSTLPEDFQGDNLTADIHLTPNGQFLYASNRGHNSLARFDVDTNNGQLTFLGTTSTQGDFPRNFAVSPDGNWLYVANQNTDNILGFTIDPVSGDLNPRVNFELPTPVCLVFE